MENIDLIKMDPYAKFLGVSFDKIEEGNSICSLVLKEHMLNFMGIIHGGVIFSLADAAFSAASNSIHTPSYALNISGSFFKPALIGDTIFAKAIKLNDTKRTGVYRIDVFKGDEVIATFNGTVFKKV